MLRKENAGVSLNVPESSYFKDVPGILECGGIGCLGCDNLEEDKNWPTFWGVA